MCAINFNWALRYDINCQRCHPDKTNAGNNNNTTRVSFTAIAYDVKQPDDIPNNFSPKLDYNSITTSIIIRANEYTPPQSNKRTRNNIDASELASPHCHSEFQPKTKFDLISSIKKNLHSRAQRKVTCIASWNVNNGFDHLAIASIMLKQDIDIFAIQEPRISNSSKDDIWLNTMRKELRKCKLEIITSQFSYLIFDEQTSGAALASVIRHVSKVHGRILSVTFKSNDHWEAHSVISVYAVTNPTSGKKYLTSRSSRKDVNAKVTKALQDEISYLRETFGEAPISIIGDFQDTIHEDHRDNIGIIGKKIHPNSPLQLLLNERFTSAFHSIFPDTQQVTRWNSSKTAGRHIDLQMMNASAASLLQNVSIGSEIAQNKIRSDHLIVIADYNISKPEQDNVDNYRKRVNFKKISGIKMRCSTKISKCPSTDHQLKEYDLTFDDSQFMSGVAQNAKTNLRKWQEASATRHMLVTLNAIELQMDQLEADVMHEDNAFNEFYDPDTSVTQQKLVERTIARRLKFDIAFSTYQNAITQVAASIKIVNDENKHIDALCLRHHMKQDKIKSYGDLIFNQATPTSKIRSALGDLKNAEATLRNLNNNYVINHRKLQMIRRTKKIII